MPQSAALLAAVPEPKIRVMVVDDAVVFRGLVSRWVSEEPDIEIVSAHRNGREAVENFSRIDPDIVVLDIEMPVLDGLATLPLLLAKKPDLTVIISSTVTRRNAEVGLRALSLGAADYVSKPETHREMTLSQEFRRELIGRIRALGRRRWERLAPPAQRAVLRPVPAVAEVAEPANAAESTYRLRPYTSMPPRVLAIGSSTGGPQALQVLMRALTPMLPRLPVLIVQHMPPVFTSILAEHIGRATGRPAAEGRDGEMLSPGTIYVAPGGKHMLVRRDGDTVRIGITDDPPIHFCRPSVDTLFTSVADVFGTGALGVILTGMGVDGAEGSAEIAARGGSVIAQDEESSVIWGMPGAAVDAGACAGVLPLDAIAPRVNELVAGVPR